MRQRIIPLAMAAFLLLGLGGAVAAQNKDDANFKKQLDLFLDEYWKFYPTAGTLAGYHKYDNTLEDLSEGSLEKRTDQLDAFNQEFVSKINKANLSPDNQIDVDIILDALDMDLFRHENLVPWEYNPLFYTEIFANCIAGLLNKDFAPLDARVKNAGERLKQIPGLVKQAKENLKTPAQVYTETAIGQFPGIIKFYREDLARLVEGAAADVKAKALAENAKAVAALEDFQNYLKNDLLPKSTGNFALGDQAHTRLFRLTTQGSLILDELVARAKADYNNLRREMALVSIPFYKIMYPDVDVEQMKRPEEELRTVIIKGVLDKIKTEHATKADYANTVKTTAESLKVFLSKSNLVDVLAENFEILPMPPEHIGPMLTLLNTPGAYEPNGKYSLELRPIPDTLATDKVQAFLEEFNNFYLPLWTSAKVYPGEYVPTALARKNTTVVRKLFANQPLIKGWSLYIGDALIKAGYGNYDLRLRLAQLKQHLKAVIDFQVELNIHQAGFTKEQAIAYYTRGGFLSEVEAERMWNQILLKPGESMYTYIGMQEMAELEKNYKRIKGDAFNKKDFLQKILSYGPIPCRLLTTRLQ